MAVLLRIGTHASEFALTGQDGRSSGPTSGGATRGVAAGGRGVSWTLCHRLGLKYCRDVSWRVILRTPPSMISNWSLSPYCRGAELPACAVKVMLLSLAARATVPAYAPGANRNLPRANRDLFWARLPEWAALLIAAEAGEFTPSSPFLGWRPEFLLVPVKSLLIAPVLVAPKALAAVRRLGSFCFPR